MPNCSRWDRFQGCRRRVSIQPSHPMASPSPSPKNLTTVIISLSWTPRARMFASSRPGAMSLAVFMPPGLRMARWIVYADQVGDALEIFRIGPDGGNAKQLTRLGKACHDSGRFTGWKMDLLPSTAMKSTGETAKLAPRLPGTPSR